ncbi:radical SAM protein [Ignicoccus pacificus DSM 13166]|uniref:Radical SAM protein n=1 Tax=Ignicoccus pacificus DSM 13166 TaxID=940294 RepID=A0A977KA43_9CREN|nr:radical SAM protein [Ignicoccus pacificus DSM 13166]
MILCEACKRNKASKSIGLCYKCLKEGKRGSVDFHELMRLRLGLPPKPPKGGLRCGLCVNECEIPEGGIGYCGIWRNEGGRLRTSSKFFTYLDPLPTNCVATPVCPAATSRGFPKYTEVPGPEVGYYNLAVFAYGCTLDCLFCQNWEHKTDLFRVRERRWEELVEEAGREDVKCVCFFGGDPTPQSPYFIRASEEILKKYDGIKRICWETNGLENPSIMRKMAELSFRSGGIVKVDWKAWSPEVYEALTGVDGKKAVERLKENTKMIAKMGKKREEPPLLVVSVLLVPLYVTLEEVEGIASYLASLDSNVPMVLLAFYPSWLMRDLPTTSERHALEAMKVARRAGVKEVYLGNEHLLSDAEYPISVEELL